MKPYFSLLSPNSGLFLGVALVWAAAALFLPAVAVFGQSPVSPTEAMLAANRSYEAGNYAQAAAGYEAILSAGIYNSDVYYNLGNAYFKQGDLGRAILNYRRAYRLAPRDADIRANLNFARSQTVDRLEVEPEGAMANLVQIAEEWLTLNEAAALALALWLVMCLLALLSILLPRRRRFWLAGIAIAAVFLAAGLVSIANRFYTDRQSPPAVVVAPQVDVTSGPGGPDQYLVEFNLHAGAEVRLLESRPGWRRIFLSHELQGWAPADAVEPVIIR